MTEDELEGLGALGRAAVWYCENGFAIFPIRAHSKAPATTHGLNDWFDDPASAAELWRRFPDYNIGIVCGGPSHGLLVLDFDVSDGKNGIETLKAWEATHGELPETAVALTGSGGRHYLYRTDRTNIRPSANVDLGVDVRCDGSYIVAPPSVHPNGDAYEWWEDPADTPIATANANVYDFLDHVQRNGGMDEDRAIVPADRFELPERIRKGERDNVLYKFGCSLRHRGESDENILARLFITNFERCDPPMDSNDVKRIARSVCKRGAGHDGQGTMKGEAAGVGRPGGSTGAEPSISYRTDKGKLIPNALGEYILQEHHARYIDGALAIWNGQRWVFSKKAIEYLCLDYAKDAKSADRTEVVKFLEVRAKSVQSTAMDHGYYIQFSNCTWDVLGEREVEPTPEMYITATLPVELDVDAPYGVADEFIASVADNDERTMRAMQEVIGACMCCKRTLSQSPMLIGRPTGGTSTASNGKSTYIDVIRALLGDENVASLDIAALGDRFGPAELMGKLANLGDDIPDGFLKGEELATFKKMVTGNKIKAERKYHDPYDFKPSATMVFSMNAMPRLADTTEGIFRRLAFVPFRRCFTPEDPDFDPNIIEKLTTPEALRRFAVLGVMALHDLLAEGRDRLTEIPDMVAAVEEIRTDNDLVRRWLYYENLGPDSLDGRWIDDAYKEFCDWCEEAGEKFVISRSGFSKRVLVTFVTLESASVRDAGGGRTRRIFRKKQLVIQNQPQA